MVQGFAENVDKVWILLFMKKHMLSTHFLQSPVNPQFLKEPPIIIFLMEELRKGRGGTGWTRRKEAGCPQFSLDVLSTCVTQLDCPLAVPPGTTFKLSLILHVWPPSQNPLGVIESKALTYTNGCVTL